MRVRTAEEMSAQPTNEWLGRWPTGRCAATDQSGPRRGAGPRIRRGRPAYLLVNSILYPSAGGGSVSSIEIGVVCSERYLRATLGATDAPGALLPSVGWV